MLNVTRSPENCKESRGFPFLSVFRCLRLTLPTAGRTNKKTALVLNANAGFWFTGRQTVLRSHQRSLQALQCSHAGADGKDAGNVGQLVGADILRDRARQHRAVVDGVKADTRLAGTAPLCGGHSRASWPGPPQRPVLGRGGLRRYRAAPCPAQCQNASPHGGSRSPGNGSSVVRSSSTGWRIKSVYFRVRRLYSRCNSFLVRSVYCIPFPLLFYLHRLLYTWEWCM